MDTEDRSEVTVARGGRGAVVLAALFGFAAGYFLWGSSAGVGTDEDAIGPESVFGVECGGWVLGVFEFNGLTASPHTLELPLLGQPERLVPLVDSFAHVAVGSFAGHQSLVADAGRLSLTASWRVGDSSPELFRYRLSGATGDSEGEAPLLTCVRP